MANDIFNLIHSPELYNQMSESSILNVNQNFSFPQKVKLLEEIINEEGSAELKCHFCSNLYQIQKEEIEVLIKEIL